MVGVGRDGDRRGDDRVQRLALVVGVARHRLGERVQPAGQLVRPVGQLMGATGQLVDAVIELVGAGGVLVGTARRPRRLRSPTWPRRRPSEPAAASSVPAPLLTLPAAARGSERPSTTLHRSRPASLRRRRCPSARLEAATTPSSMRPGRRLLGAESRRQLTSRAQKPAGGPPPGTSRDQRLRRPASARRSWVLPVSVVEPVQFRDWVLAWSATRSSPRGDLDAEDDSLRAPAAASSMPRSPASRPRRRAAAHRSTPVPHPRPPAPLRCRAGPHPPSATGCRTRGRRCCRPAARWSRRAGGRSSPCWSGSC